MRNKSFFGPFIVSVIFTFHVKAAETMYGVFMVVKGDIKIENSSKQATAAKVGSKILPGETVISGADARAKIVMSDRNVINVSPDTKMAITKYENDPASGTKNVELNLLAGKVRNNVEQTYDGEKSKFLMKTPTAVAGVRGTQFITEFNAVTRMTSVVTLMGQVSLASISASGKPVGAPVLINKNETTTASAEGPPPPPKSLPKEAVKALDNETTASNSKKEDSSQASSKDPNDKGGDKAEKDKGDKQVEKSGEKPPEKQADKGEKSPDKQADKGPDKQPGEPQQTANDGTKKENNTPDNKKVDRDVASAPNPMPTPGPMQESSMIDKRDLDMGMARDIRNPVAPPPPPPAVVNVAPTPSQNTVVKDIIKGTAGKATITIRPIPQ